jgi:hypothetical protein
MLMTLNPLASKSLTHGKIIQENYDHFIILKVLIKINVRLDIIKRNIHKNHYSKKAHMPIPKDSVDSKNLNRLVFD